MVNRILAPDDLPGFAAEIAARLKPGMALLLNGPLGAGKTTLARALVNALAGEEIEVASPTFPLCLTYDMPDGTTIWHYDLYRLTDGADLEELGWTEARHSGISIVEWPERARDIRPPFLRVTLDFTGKDDERTATIEEVAA